MKRYRHVNGTVIGRAHAGPVQPTQPSVDGPAARLALVVGAEVSFFVLVDLVTRAPPAFVTIVAFGIALAIGLGWQTRISSV